ncbi:MAG: substrate-binding periplasmic protein [Bdellovibrionales bacterium]
MKVANLLLVFALSAATAFAVGRYVAPPTAPKEESAFDRVMRTGVLRCGYYVFPPVVMRDPNTGEMSGLTIDMMKAFSEKTGIKVEWTEESTFGNWIPALQAKRYDIMCAPMFPDMALGREAIFTNPLFYAGIYPLVREDDTRFDGPDALEKMNSPETTFLVQDGNMTLFLTKETFPKAKLLTIAAQVDGPSMMQNIATGKADAVLLDRNGQIEYSKYGTKLKVIELPKPLKAQAFTLPMNRKDTELRDFMNNVILDLLTCGTINRLLDKWESVRGKIFLRVAEPYAPEN